MEITAKITKTIRVEDNAPSECAHSVETCGHYLILSSYCSLYERTIDHQGDNQYARCPRCITEFGYGGE